MNVASSILMINNSAGSPQAATDIVVNGSGQEVWGLAGDSIALGLGEVVGPTPTSGTVYEFNGTIIVEVSNDDLIQAFVGSPWPKYAIDYNTGNSRKPVFSHTAATGSEFYPNGDNSNWYTSGTLYATFKTKLDNALISAAVTKPKGIIVILGINDAKGAQSLANISIAIASLISRLNSDYNTPNIYFCLPGRDDSNFSTTRHQHIKRDLIQASKSAENIHVPISLLPLYAWSDYSGDDIHPDQGGNNKIGELVARYILNTTQISKVARGIIASFNDDISSTKKAAIETFINSFPFDFRDTFDSLQIYVGDTDKNCLIDFAMRTAPLKVNTVTFNSKSHYQVNGTNSYLRTYLLQDATTNSTNTDFIEFVKTKVVTTAAGTEAILFGRSNGTIHTRLRQGTDNQLHFECYDATDSVDDTNTKFQDNTIYAIGRDGTDKILKKDAVELKRLSVASTGAQSTRDAFVGAGNNNGSIHLPINAGVQVYGLARLSKIPDWSAFVSNLNTLLTALAV